MKGHCHITGKYRGVVHGCCNFKVRIKPKTEPIPVVFYNLRGNDADLLFQVMSRIDREISFIPNSAEKYISFHREDCFL